jgi:hypothetical protein
LPAAGLLSTAPWAVRAQFAPAGWRSFETVTRLEITAPTGALQAWLPLPLSQDTDWFQTLEHSVSGNFEMSRIVHEPIYRAAMVAATFKAGEPQPVIEVTSRFRTRDRRVELRPGAGMQATTAERAI